MATSNMQLAEHVWMLYASNINHGFVNDVLVDAAVENAIGSDGMALIAERFQSMIQAPVKIKNRGSLPTLISPVTNTDWRETITLTKPKAKTVPKKAKVARPPNAFILYRQHHHPIVKAQSPDLHNNQISIMLGQQWQNEAADIKAQFKSMAEKIKKEHLSAHPNYQYQPRKPAEKKRRMTRRKAEKLNAQAESSKTPTDTATIPAFEKTSTGNAVFTLGDDSIKDDPTLMAMLQKHNRDVMASTTHYVEPAGAALFSERSEEAHDDASFYGNMLNFDEMYPSEYGPNDLLPADAAMLAMVSAAGDDAMLAAFDYNLQKKQHAEYHRELSRFSTLWTPSSPNHETPSIGDIV
uniref:Mating-type protein MAT1-2-1 n=1 Tax=Dufourea flammea TaxID=115814 RepID=Q4GZL4_9LECA|nr:mating-type protein MAT1-2-1 [Dufourea flammea]